MSSVTWLVVALLVQTAHAQSGPPASVAPYCPEAVSCVEYQLLCSTDQYDVRFYPNTDNFIATSLTTASFVDAAVDGFPKVIQYLKGANDQNVASEVPQPSVVIASYPPTSEGTYMVIIILPDEWQQNPPTPTDPEVNVVTYPPIGAYSYSYKGWVSEQHHFEQVKILTDALDAAGASFDSSSYTTSFYRSPSGEVTVEVKVAYYGEPVC